MKRGRFTAGQECLEREERAYKEESDTGRQLKETKRREGETRERGGRGA